MKGEPRWQALSWALAFSTAVLVAGALWLWRSEPERMPPERPTLSIDPRQARNDILAQAKLVPAPRDTSTDDARPGAEVRGVTPEPRLKKRPKTEWQGMLVDLAVAPTCMSTEMCSLGQSCKRGACGPGEPADGECYRCLPCESDRECLRGELCVLDHCVKGELVSCRRSADCPGVPCVLSGYSSGPRNNGDMKAYCPDVNAGTELAEEEAPEPMEAKTGERPPPLHQRLETKLRQSYAETPQ